MSERLLTIADVSERLGMSRSWLYQQVEYGTIPHYRLGRAIRFDQEAVMAWIAGEEYEGKGGNDE